MSRDLKNEEELLGEERGRCFPGRGIRAQHIQGTGSKPVGPGCGDQRVEACSPDLEPGRHKINVGFLDFPLS